MLGLIRKITRRLMPRQGPIVNGTTVGADARIERGALVCDSTIGQAAYVGPEARLFGVDLGSYASIGPRVTVGENEHEQNLFSTSDVLFECIDRAGYAAARALRTDIGADVWIGANAFIRKGTRIGVGAIVGAHTVVLKDVPPYAIMVGVPARLIGYRFSAETRAELEQSAWWTMGKARLQAAIVQRYGLTETPDMQDEQEMLAFVRSLPASRT
jgi:acetyltransferase-like isoleucine patch superfamily enzyme